MTGGGVATPRPLHKVQFIHGLNADRQLFADNIKANIGNTSVSSLRTRKAMLVAGGPSASDYLEVIRRLKGEGWELFTVNGAHDWLVKNGIFPTACVVMESQAVVDTFIRNPQHDCTYYLASQVNPLLFNRLVNGGFNVVMFHAELDNEATALVEEIDHNPTILAGAPTVGLHTLGVCYILGIRKMQVYGLDSSHRGEADHSYDNSQQGPVDTIEFIFKGERFTSTGTWASQADRFAKMWPMYFKLGMRIEVFGDGLLPAMYRHEKEKLLTELQQRAGVQTTRT
jgi:hypothetical protein